MLLLTTFSSCSSGCGSVGSQPDFYQILFWPKRSWDRRSVKMKHQACVTQLLLLQMQLVHCSHMGFLTSALHKSQSKGAKPPCKHVEAPAKVLVLAGGYKQRANVIFCSLEMKLINYWQIATQKRRFTLTAHTRFWNTLCWNTHSVAQQTHTNKTKQKKQCWCFDVSLLFVWMPHSDFKCINE